MLARKKGYEETQALYPRLFTHKQEDWYAMSTLICMHVHDNKQKLSKYT